MFAMERTLDNMEIISKEPIMDATTPIITFIVIIMIFAVVVYIGFKLHCEEVILVAGFLLLIAIIPFSYLEMKIKEFPSGRYRYEIKIKDNSISAKNFLEEYDIIGFEDGIYTIEDKCK